MFSERISAGSTKTQVYFGAALVVFILSFMLGASSKLSNNLFYAFIALPGVFFLLKHRGAGVFSQPLGLAWAVFLLWFLVPAFNAGDFQFYKHIAYVSLFVFAIAAFTDVHFFRSGLFVRSLFWIVCLYIFVSSIRSWMTGEFVFGERVGILMGRMDNVIYASVFLFCALGLAFPGWVKERRWIEATLAVALSLFAVTFVVQTRTALVGAAFLFGLWALYLIYRFPRQGVIGLLAFAVAAALVFWLIHDESWVKALFVRGDSYRIELFQIMTGEWRNCGWLLGCGIGFHTTQTLTGGLPIQHPHNIFVAMGLYAGAIALVLFCAVMALTLWQAIRLRDAWGFYLACALLMLNFDGSMLVGNPDELWILVLLPATMILGRVVQEHRLKQQ
ncbi:O-antigen ligase domain-containing protein [Pseudomonas sp. NPDC089734]|uniref:O-antigen ligase domain-containing protein n=1 Tax=Pseudomonas sp. NPDC089734 TaxID=3364469 RepID=UPI00381A39DE